jgi:hypothetical protein
LNAPEGRSVVNHHVMHPNELDADPAGFGIGMIYSF